MNLKLLVPVALIAIGAGLYGLSGNLLKEKQVADAPNEQAKEVLFNVWMAKESISQGEPVSRKQFQLKKVSQSEANSHGISKDVQLKFTKGMVAIQDIKPDEWVGSDSFLTPDQDGYINLTIKENMVPYGIKVESETIVGGVITHGSLIDVIALSSTQQNLATESKVTSFQSISISPVLTAVKVLKVQTNESVFDKATKSKKNQESEQVSLILELSRSQIAKLVIAKRIAQLEIHKSIGAEHAEELKANSGDVLPTYRAIKELRAGSSNIK